MGMEGITISQVRASLPALVSKAHFAGTTTVITRHGRRVAMIGPYREEFSDHLEVEDVKCWTDLEEEHPYEAWLWLVDPKRRWTWWQHSSVPLSEWSGLSDAWVRGPDSHVMVEGQYLEVDEEHCVRYSCKELNRGVRFELTLRFDPMPPDAGTGTRLSARLTGWQQTLTDAVAAAEYRMLWQRRLDRLQESVRADKRGAAAA